MLRGTAIAGLEQAINRALQLDPACGRQLQQLDGRRFALSLQQPDLFIGIAIRGEQIGLIESDQGDFTTRLSGRWSEFARIASADDPAAALINGDVQVTGDTGPLLELRGILASLELDWEQPLSRAFGDVAGHQIGKGLRAGHRWLLGSGRNLQRQARDFLLEESRLLPHPYQAEHFYREVDDLKARSERLEARLRRLAQRIHPPQHQ
ncbi:SCP2 sterol-binding domain-containing protein [Spongiibacter nanhainus]|uniref:Ubiquinone biosynthesis accessory factor UbiJ n=1 Tax=Spongiibacter nanhainus TaxID=2794344 RepID=A0A7T4R231_9GAMM|nr:SCP2 sterol-binding domain-containing protein [Spongiibacter nanhainus]QQD18960.1 SCP2 sterol-binding domain-containing protein [Spongiibacter nanhainus]